MRNSLGSGTWRPRLGDDLIVGIVLYTGPRTLSSGPELKAVPVAAIWEVG